MQLHNTIRGGPHDDNFRRIMIRWLKRRGHSPVELADMQNHELWVLIREENDTFMAAPPKWWTRTLLRLFGLWWTAKQRWQTWRLRTGDWDRKKGDW